jgi:hypothetical protein
MAMARLISPIELEKRLVTHYLRTDGPGGAGALRFIDASRSEVRDALQLQLDDHEVLPTLADGCGGEEQIFQVLSQGWNAIWPDRETPGFFRFLLLTCAVVASADSNDKTQEFGSNLQILLGTTRRFNQRAGLPNLWYRLTQWCAERNRSGAPIRLLDLPSPLANQTKIGQTNAVSFPNWRDILQLRGELARRNITAGRLRSPSDAAIRLCPLITAEAGFSAQMILARKEYEALYYTQSSLLHLHRLWAVAVRALNLTRPKRTVTSVELRIELLLGVVAEDCLLGLTLVDTDGSSIADGNLPAEVPVDSVTSRLADSKTPRIPSVVAYEKALHAGAIGFRAERIGDWVADLRAPQSGDPWIYLIASHFQRRIASLLPPIKVERVSDNWFRVGPVESPRVGDIHRLLGLNAQGRTDELSPVVVQGGIRTVRGLLGRPSVLPRISKQGPGRLTISGPAGSEITLAVVAIDNELASIKASAPLDGVFRIRLEEGDIGSQTLAVEKPIRFASDASEHPELRNPEPKQWTVAQEGNDRAWSRTILPSTLRASESRQDVASDEERHFDDFLELVYARGRSGWAEVDLVSEIRTLLPGPSPWDVLRGLEEGGWLGRTTSVGWRATRHWLIKPMLVPVRTQDLSGVLLWGSTPTVVRRRFEMTARELGGITVTLQGVGPYSPRLVTALCVDAEKLATELGWHIVDSPTAARIAAPACWPSGKLEARNHRIYRKWDWHLGRFIACEDRPLAERVSVSQWRREEGDRADLYKVEARGHPPMVFASRCVALAEGHRLNKQPMFRSTLAGLMRIPRDGHLPLPLARSFVREALQASGPVRTSEGWSYAYPSSQPARKLVDFWMGYGFIENSDPKALYKGTVDDPWIYGVARHRPKFRPERLSAAERMIRGRNQ